MSTCGVAVMLATGIFIGLDIPSYRKNLEADLATTAAMVSANSQAALAFNDDKYAREILAGLEAKSLVLAGCLYKEHGTLLTSYERAGSGVTCPQKVPTLPPASFLSARLATSQPVMGQDQQWGTVYLVATQQPLRDRLRWYLFLTAKIGRAHV